LVHTSNLYLTGPMLDLAARLRELTGWPDARSFFCQDGATANEAAIKLARRHGKRLHPAKVRMVTLEGSFHGRSLATLEATGQPDKHEPFAPLAGFVDTVPYDDPDALARAVTDDHCAVLLEIVQGEGGVRPVPTDVLQAARAACDAHGALLLVDEVQTGVGRTGTWFAHQQVDVQPDVVSLAKALANGLPIGAIVARGHAATAFQPGDHATTFGGNPVTAAAALATLDVIASEGILDNIAERSEQLRNLAEGIEGVVGTRGMGLLLGIELASPIAGAATDRCRDSGLLVNAVAPDVVRIAPPLTVSADECDRAMEILAHAITGRTE
jgi:acetylornithine aminotransferase